MRGRRPYKRTGIAEQRVAKLDGKCRVMLRDQRQLVPEPTPDLGVRALQENLGQVWQIAWVFRPQLDSQSPERGRWMAGKMLRCQGGTKRRFDRENGVRPGHPERFVCRPKK